jgi:hypothetical protein
MTTNVTRMRSQALAPRRVFEVINVKLNRTASAGISRCPQPRLRSLQILRYPVALSSGNSVLPQYICNTEAMAARSSCLRVGCSQLDHVRRSRCSPIPRQGRQVSRIHVVTVPECGQGHRCAARDGRGSHRGTWRSSAGPTQHVRSAACPRPNADSSRHRRCEHGGGIRQRTSRWHLGGA